MITINETNVTIMVHDMNKAIAFYQGIGLALKQRWDNHYAMLTAPGLTIGLHPTEEKNTSSGNLSIGFMIDSVENAKSMLNEKKITHTEQEDGKSGSYLHFKDPFGTILYFVKPKWK